MSEPENLANSCSRVLHDGKLRLVDYEYVFGDDDEHEHDCDGNYGYDYHCDIDDN